MKIVGITGRSGCGKSSVTAWLAAAGYPCVDADRIARAVTEPGSACLPALQARFGADILDKNGQLCRRLLAQRAFATPEGTAALTAITFPEIARRVTAAARAAQAQGSKLFFVDGAVLVGTPFARECQTMVLVTAPYAQSVRRICARDGVTPETARQRLDAQTPEAVLRAAADYEIVNDGNFARLITQARAMLARLQKEDNEKETDVTPESPDPR